MVKRKAQEVDKNRKDNSLLKAVLPPIIAGAFGFAITVVSARSNPQQFVNYFSGGTGFVPETEYSQLQQNNKDLQDRVDELSRQLESVKNDKDDAENGEVSSATTGDSASRSSNLFSRAVNERSDFSYDKDKAEADATENTYKPGSSAILSPSVYDFAYVRYYLGKEAKHLSGTVAVSANTFTGTTSPIVVRILVKAEGDTDYREIYATKEISRDTAPIKIDNLDISDADWIQIQAECAVNKSYSVVKALLADFTLS